MCPEWGAGVVSSLTFSWLSPLIRKGYKAPLQDKDIWTLPPTDRSVLGNPGAVSKIDKATLKTHVCCMEGVASQDHAECQLGVVYGT